MFQELLYHKWRSSCAHTLRAKRTFITYMYFACQRVNINQSSYNMGKIWEKCCLTGRAKYTSTFLTRTPITNRPVFLPALMRDPYPKMPPSGDRFVLFSWCDMCVKMECLKRQWPWVVKEILCVFMIFNNWPVSPWVLLYWWTLVIKLTALDAQLYERSPVFHKQAKVTSITVFFSSLLSRMFDH